MENQTTTVLFKTKCYCAYNQQYKAYAPYGTPLVCHIDVKTLIKRITRSSATAEIARDAGVGAHNLSII